MQKPGLAVGVGSPGSGAGPEAVQQRGQHRRAEWGVPEGPWMNLLLHGQPSWVLQPRQELE